MSLEPRGGRFIQTKKGEHEAIPRKPGDIPEVVATHTRKRDVEFLKNIVNEIDWKTAGALIETYLAKSDVSDPKVTGYPRISHSTRGSWYWPPADLAGVNLTNPLKILGSKSGDDLRLTFRERLKEFIGIDIHANLRAKWASSPEFKILAITNIFHEILHGFEKLRRDKDGLAVEQGYKFLGGGDGFGEGANELAALVMAIRYSRMKGIVPESANFIRNTLIRQSPYLLLCYAVILTAGKIAQEDVDPTKTVDSLIRGHFNEGKAVLSRQSVGEELYKKIHRIQYAMPKSGQNNDEELCTILREEFGVEGDTKELINKAVSAVFDYAETSSSSSISDDRYTSPS